MKVDYCEYDKTSWSAEVKIEILRDKFASGLINDTFQVRLLIRDTNELTLEQAVSLAQQSE